MMEPLTLARLDDMILGGLVLSAGGSGAGRAARYRRMAEQALDYAQVRLTGLNDLPDDAPVFVATGVGAPGFAKGVLTTADSIQSARMLSRATGVEPAAVMPGHVPGVMTLMQAAVLGVPVLDATTNGRGHPTVKMGGMGLAARPEVRITQAGCGGAADDRVEIVVSGGLAKTSTIMRAASVQNGGMLYATRGPFSVRLVREGGAPGALSFAERLGAAMRGADSGLARVEAAAAALCGEVLAHGPVASVDVVYGGGFDVGTVAVADPRGRIVLHVYNEFMAADRDGERQWTFPDMIGSLDPATGDVVAINEMQPGRPVAIVAGPRTAFPVGASARDPGVFGEVEEKLGVKLATYLTG